MPSHKQKGTDVGSGAAVAATPEPRPPPRPELTANSGGVIGCHIFEKLLDATPDLNIVHLRAVFFMENFLQSIGLIKMAGFSGMAIGPTVSFPMIATRDIATVAADYLVERNFLGSNIRYLNGPRDYTMTEAARILGASVGRRGLKYVELPVTVFRKGLISAGGLSPNAAELAIQTNQSIDSGRFRAEPRSPWNTTPTSLEEFAKDTFAPAFSATSEPSLPTRLGGVLLRSYLSMTGHRPV